MHEPRQAIHMGKALETAWVRQGLRELLGGNGGQTVTARLMDTQIWYLTLVSVWGGLLKGNMASATPLVWEKAAPPVLMLMPDTSVSPRMSLVPLDMLYHFWSSERVSQNKSTWETFKRNCLGLQKPSVSFSLNSCWFLQLEVMETSLHRTGILGLGV